MLKGITSIQEHIIAGRVNAKSTQTIGISICQPVSTILKINLAETFFDVYFELQSTFMTEQNQSLAALQDIKNMMERSSRFISLSGLSGISAGICALIGAWFANDVIHSSSAPVPLTDVNLTDYSPIVPAKLRHSASLLDYADDSLLRIAIITFIAAFAFAFTFTYLRSKKTGVPLWGKASKRLMINVCVPLAVGGAFVLKLLTVQVYGLIAPGCLIFYGLALVNASKYTLSEVRYLGYCNLLLGLVNLVYPNYGLYFWALGFGVLHIIYGAAMWWRYERKGAEG